MPILTKLIFSNLKNNRDLIVGLAHARSAKLLGTSRLKVIVMAMIVH